MDPFGYCGMSDRTFCRGLFQKTGKRAGWRIRPIKGVMGLRLQHGQRKASWLAPDAG